MPNLLLLNAPLDLLTITSEKGMRVSPSDGKDKPHEGMDFAAAGGTNLYCAHFGKVIYADKKGSYGNIIVIQDQESGQSTLYAHLSKILVAVGEEISEERTLIGKTGNTGGTAEHPYPFHLHFEILDKDHSDTLRDKGQLPSQGGRLNPRSFIAASPFRSMLSPEVHSGQLGFGLREGDDRDNVMIRDSNGQARQMIFDGLGGRDTYYLKSKFKDDVIDDQDGDGIVVIDGKKLEGNALPKTDANGNILEGVWTLSGFDLYKSSSGNGLVICRANADILSGTTGRVLVQNFPFSNSRGGFGITLGKTKDLSTDANGNVISKIGYDSSTKSLPAQQYFYSRDFAKTSDDTGFFGFVAQASDTPSSLSTYKLRIGNFDHAGNKVGEQELSEFPITVASAIYFQKYQDSKTGEDAYLVPFESDYRDSSNIRQSKVGFCLLNKSGQKLSSQVVASNSGNNKLLFAANIATLPDQDYFYLAYVDQSCFLRS